jgi:CheY-like chemotaxis protein
MNEPVEILLVEDNPADVLLVQEALKDARVYNTLHVVNDGESAIDFLHFRSGLNPGKIRPGLVLLDLYMPKRNGLEVLKDIKLDPSLKSIPVVVMTSSQEEKDIAEAYELQANCYVTKPVDFDQLTKVIKTIEDFWLTLVKLPTRG